MTQLQLSIEETETNGQLLAVSPLAATAGAEGDSKASKSPQHDVLAASEDGEDTTGQ